MIKVIINTRAGGVAQPDVLVQHALRSEFSPQCHHNKAKAGEWLSDRVFAL